MDSIRPVQDMDKWRAVISTRSEFLVPQKGVNFLNEQQLTREEGLRSIQILIHSFL